MTVKITKSNINLREELNKLRKPSGIAGEAMLRADTPQEQFKMIGAGRRNLFINGDFSIAQRGTDVVQTAGSNYGNYLALDRWATYYFGTQQTQRQEVVDGEIRDVMRITSTQGNSCYVYQMIENGATLYQGQTLTLSFWVRCSKNALMQGTNSVRYYDYGYGGYTYHAGNYSDVDITTEWKYVTRKIRLVEQSEQNKHLFVLFDVPSTYIDSGDWVEYSNMQLEVGEVATPFEKRHKAEELALCQRYYWQFDQDVGNGNSCYAAAEYSANNWRVTVDLPVTMRASPAVTSVWGTGGGAVTNDYRGIQQLGFYHTSAYRMDTNGGKITADAEL